MILQEVMNPELFVLSDFEIWALKLSFDQLKMVGLA